MAFNTRYYLLSCASIVFAFAILWGTSCAPGDEATALGELRRSVQKVNIERQEQKNLFEDRTSLDRVLDMLDNYGSNAVDSVSTVYSARIVPDDPKHPPMLLVLWFAEHFDVAGIRVRQVAAADGTVSDVTYLLPEEEYRGAERFYSNRRGLVFNLALGVRFHDRSIRSAADGDVPLSVVSYSSDAAEEVEFIGYVDIHNKDTRLILLTLIDSFGREGRMIPLHRVFGAEHGKR